MTAQVGEAPPEPGQRVNLLCGSTPLVLADYQSPGHVVMMPIPPDSRLLIRGSRRAASGDQFPGVDVSGETTR